MPETRMCSCGEPTQRPSGLCAMCETDGGLFKAATAPAHTHSQDCFSEGTQVCGVLNIRGTSAKLEVDEWPFQQTDLKVDVFRAPDQGGFGSTPDRHVRVTHLPSGLQAESYEERSPHRNKVDAMRELANKVRQWKAAGSPAPRPKAEDVAAALAVITRALAPAPKGLGVQPEDAVATLAEIRQAVIGYYDAMVARQHGGVAMSQAMNKIEELFGLHYDTYRDSKKP